ncbi:hypothetical protein [Haliscomenobacter hydrossis]|uniref:Uncharacterized protein n=1 Tax=Haliscomenobacter hydrossis (strain ATCC 27775 / DSM 1100 / LMG 10767 / O) TaxID=760192 RepID=F4KUE1_HALH1|nr:hypothetical protein [Haliscomenobacter hydrossis]AEE51223.1 hypothetical protein Halhy_3365 [Haliscomenobacter hydrossis DSM 1100]
MKTYLLLGFLLGASLSLSAQNRAYAPLARAYGTNLFPSNDPEDKDISIMTGILSKLVQQEFNNGDTAINIERIKGSYIPGSGILFTINQRVPFYSQPMLLGVNGRSFAPGRYGLTTTAGQAADVVVVETPKATGSGAKVKTTEKPLSTAGQESIYGVPAPNPIAITSDSGVLFYGQQGQLHSYSGDAVTLYTNPKGNSAKVQDSVFAAKIPRMKKVLEKFLAEYTILLSKLKPEEKIWVTWTIKEDYWGIDQGRMACELSSRIVKQDMLDLRAGKLDQAKFAEKIQYSVTRCAERVTNPEVEVFTAILERLYSPNVSQNLVQFGAVQAEAVGGFGYVFKMNFSPARIDSLIEYNPNTYATQLKVKGIPKEELDQRIKTFKVEFPQQLLEYSRILKGLKAGEILKVDVSIGEYAHLWRSSTEGYKQFSLTIPQSLIRDFDSGKLKLEDAVKLIQVEEK